MSEKSATDKYHMNAPGTHCRLLADLGGTMMASLTNNVNGEGDQGHIVCNVVSLAMQSVRELFYVRASAD